MIRIFLYHLHCYWESCFSSFPILSSQFNYLVARVTTPPLFRECWGELLDCPNNYWEKKNLRETVEALFSYQLSQYDSWIEEMEIFIVVKSKPIEPKMIAFLNFKFIFLESAKQIHIILHDLRKLVKSKNIYASHINPQFSSSIQDQVQIFKCIVRLVVVGGWCSFAVGEKYCWLWLVAGANFMWEKSTADVC